MKAPEKRVWRRWAIGVGALAAIGAVAGSVREAPRPGLDSFYAAWGVARDSLPYRSDADARRDIAAAKARAAAQDKLLMVTFGANWCPDCLSLHRSIHDPVAEPYVERTFEIVNVDASIGTNIEAARELGLAVHSIPLAVFYLPDGTPLGDTSRGELKPARHYSSAQILSFLREVAEQHRIVSPDQRQ
jgi:thiol-disulfide isomerase/thioredoxin